jgi:hypothetical protein
MREMAREAGLLPGLVRINRVGRDCAPVIQGVTGRAQGNEIEWLIPTPGRYLPDVVYVKSENRTASRNRATVAGLRQNDCHRSQQEFLSFARWTDSLSFGHSWSNGYAQEAQRSQ